MKRIEGLVWGRRIQPRLTTGSMRFLGVINLTGGDKSSWTTWFNGDGDVKTRSKKASIEKWTIISSIPDKQITTCIYQTNIGRKKNLPFLIAWYLMKRIICVQKFPTGSNFCIYLYTEIEKDEFFFSLFRFYKLPDRVRWSTVGTGVIWQIG